MIFKKFAVISRQDHWVSAFCPTRWTVRAEVLTFISEIYQSLQSTWEAAKQAIKDSEMRAQVMFDYFFGVELGRKCCEGQGIVRTSPGTLIRTDEKFALLR